MISFLSRLLFNITLGLLTIYIIGYFISFLLGIFYCKKSVKDSFQAAFIWPLTYAFILLSWLFAKVFEGYKIF